MVKEQVIGVVYALPFKIVDRILSKKNAIFIKYLSKGSIKKSNMQIKEGDKLYFYVSRSEKIIVGESIIERIEFLTKKDLMKKHSSDIILTISELDEYTKGRENKPILILEINDIKKYSKPIRLTKCVNMGGLYITKENERLILG